MRKWCQYNLHYLPHWLQLLWMDKNLPKIHVIGDSHASFCFTNVLPVRKKHELSIFKIAKKKVPFSIHWMGPMTMHRVGRDGLEAINLKSLDVRNNDLAVFVFGEIDVRCHIEKQSILQNKPIEVIIETLAQNYVRAILENKKQFSSLKCVVCTIIPPTDRAFNVNFPFHGSLKTRIEVTHSVNRKLQELCLQHDISVLNLYDDYCSTQGDLKEEISDGGVHISHHFNHGIKQKLIGF